MMDTQELYDIDELEVAFELTISQFIDYKDSNEIVRFLFSLPPNTWINLSLFSNKFSFLSNFIANNKLIHNLKISISWMRHPTLNNPYHIIIFLEETMGYTRIAFYNNQLLHQPA